MLRCLSEITDSAARRRLGQYLACLRRWSPKINLTGADTDDAAFETLIRPVLGAETLLSGSVIDVGSGNGSPGLILAALTGIVVGTILESRKSPRGTL